MKILRDFDNKFDLVVSLGNTFTNIPENELQESLKRSLNILKPNGQMLIQVLNYKKILTDEQRIINVTESDDKFFIRFYDFNDVQVVFNLLTFSKNNISDYKLSSTEIHPHVKEDFESRLKKLGVSDIQLYGDLKLSEFQPLHSKNFIIKTIKD